MKMIRWTIALACLSSTTAGAGNSPLVNNVREANQRFVNASAAVAEGYAPITCASGAQGGAMGIHYVNAGLLKDGVVDIAKPEAIMCEPTGDGKLALVAVEYIASNGPAELEDHLFNFNSAPNRYGPDPFCELHVWA